MVNTAIDYKTLFEIAPDPSVLLLPDFTVVAANDAYLKAADVLRDNVIGKNFFNAFPNELSVAEDALRSSLGHVLSSKTSHIIPSVVQDILNADGSHRLVYKRIVNSPLLFEGELKYILHRTEDISDVVLDGWPSTDPEKDVDPAVVFKAQRIQEISHALVRSISDAHMAKEDVALAHAHFQTAIDAPQKILMFSVDRELRYMFFNAAFRNSTFLAYGTIVRKGMHLLDSVTVEEDRLKIKANCERALSGEEHIRVEDYGSRHKVYFETWYAPVKDEQGQIIGVMVRSEDVTQKRLAQEQVEALNRDLNSFTYSVAHDLRAPLRAIDGYAAILQETAGGNLDEEGKRLLHVVASNARKMGELIDDLLKVSRSGREPLKSRNVDIDALLQRIIDEQADPHTLSGYHLDVKKLEPARCDGALIQLVFSNLLSNAMKYCRHREHPYIQIGCEKRNDEVIYYVRDNGVGFDMQFSHKLFGIFQRLHRPTDYEGNGVGLAIVHRLVAKHGGRVWAEGEVDKGATFYFSLPA